ncbi:MAG: hypothetical protein H6632_10310 [Anaerolineales bacterium]|nr:hypothetical protein [Anaerolineales bacterium]
MQHAQPNSPPIVVNLHGLTIAFQAPDQPLKDRFEQVYGHLPRQTGGEPDITIDWHIHQHPAAPPPPPGMPSLAETPLVSYYGAGDLVVVRLPKYGLVAVDLANSRLIGAVTRLCLEAYGVFEDVLMIALAPLYRRRGWFPLHAFAALAPNGRAALITGHIGSGKTTTGLALMNAGWKLLSNDSPLLRLTNHQVEVLAYPGQLSAFDDSLARFDTLKRFIPTDPEPEALNLLAPAGPQKRVFRAEDVFTEPWASTGLAGGVFFPQVVPGLNQSELVPVPPTKAALELVPQAIEGWDKATVPPSLHLVRTLVEQAPCFILRLSPQVEQLAGVISRGMRA